MSLLSLLYVTMVIMITVVNKYRVGIVGVAFHHSGIIATTYSPAMTLLMEHVIFTGMTGRLLNLK